MEASYLGLTHNKTLSHRLEDAVSLMQACSLCPRECGVNRLEGELGVCQTGKKAIIASYHAHFGEESPLVGRYGSGTIFISSCNLLCSFCQNYEISHLMEGVEVEADQIASMMLQLQEQGCHNINFVTPTHVVPQLIEAISIAIQKGLRIPLVYNSSGYDKKETLKILKGIFDIYMPDFKFWDPTWSERYCKAPNYRDVAMEAIKEMHSQVGDLVLDDQGIAVRGLLVRHLVMPNRVSGTNDIAHFIAQKVSPNCYVNIMDQYRPCGDAHKDDMINRRLTAQEFRDATDTARKAGLNRLDPRDRIRFMVGL